MRNLFFFLSKDCVKCNLENGKCDAIHSKMLVPRPDTEVWNRNGGDYELHKDMPVFVSLRSGHEGERFLPESITYGFKKIAKRAGLGRSGFHDLRHTHARDLFYRGAHPKIVQERLGHDDISTTMNTYTEWIPSLQEDVAARFDLGLDESKFWTEDQKNLMESLQITTD